MFNLSKKQQLILKHILFWVLVLAYFTSTRFQQKSDLYLVSRITVFELFIQIGVAYTITLLLIPKLLHKNKKKLFVISFIGLIILAHNTFSAYLNYYIRSHVGHVPIERFIERSLDTFGYIKSFVSYFSPTLLIVLYNYSQKEKEVAKLLEQKTSTELNALKNQLNPHFLFNTLNNLYTLALKKSDKTPEVIAKLSEILDYILYRCNDKFVFLKSEVDLLKNYIELEKVRYGNRVNIEFTETVSSDAKIAPLLLLTFLENAFKHGVSQELGTAQIAINITATKEEIDFRLKNTKPQIHKDQSTINKGIGLVNINKQLNLLYSTNYTLLIEDENEFFAIHLKIKSPHV